MKHVSFLRPKVYCSLILVNNMFLLSLFIFSFNKLAILFERMPLKFNGQHMCTNLLMFPWLFKEEESNKNSFKNNQILFFVQEYLKILVIDVEQSDIELEIKYLLFFSLAYLLVLNLLKLFFVSG